MSAGRESHRADVVGIDFILGGVGAQPAHGRFAVLDLGGEASMRRGQTVIGRDGDVTAAGESTDGLTHFLALASDPTAGVDAHHGGIRPRAVRRHRQIEFEVGIAAFAEDDVGFFMNRRTIGGRRRDWRQEARQQAQDKGSHRNLHVCPRGIHAPTIVIDWLKYNTGGRLGLWTA